MTTDYKVIELFCIIDEFCKHFDAENAGILPFYKIGGKILYKQTDIQTMLERHYNPIPQTGKL